MALTGRLRLNGKRILWLEDRPETITFELVALQGAGADVVQLERPRDGFNELISLKRNFDLVILDIVLPENEMPRQLGELKAQANIPDESAHNGLIIALWLSRYKQEVPFFFYTIVPGVPQDCSVLLNEVDPEKKRMIYRGNKSFHSEGFIELVLDMLRPRQ